MLFAKLVVRATAAILVVGGPVGAVVWLAYAGVAGTQLPGFSGLLAFLYYGLLVAIPVALVGGPLCAGLMVWLLRRSPSPSVWMRYGLVCGAAAGFLLLAPLAVLAAAQPEYAVSFPIAGAVAGLATGGSLARVTRDLLTQTVPAAAYSGDREHRIR